MSTPPDAQYQAIQTALTLARTTAGGDDLNLITWLQSQTNDAEGFLDWAFANAQQAGAQPPAPTTAADALTALKSTTFTNLGSVMALESTLTNCAPIPLVRARQTQYFVVPDAMPVAMKGDLNPLKEDEADDATDLPEDPFSLLTSINVHPNFLTPVQVTPGATREGSALPQFVFPLGLVQQRDIRPASQLTQDERDRLGDAIDQRPLEDTNYAAVVDVVTTGNPLWLIYNRNPYDEIEDAPVPINPAEMPAVFPGAVGSNFDTAQALASLAAWSVGTPATPSFTDFVALVNGTKVRGEVRCTPVWMDDLVKVLPGAAIPPPA